MDSGPLTPANGQVLREIQAFPIEMNRQAAPAVYSPLPAQDSVLREYLRVLIKRKWVIISTLAVVFGAVAIATLRTTPIYEAAGSIAINKADPCFSTSRMRAAAGSTITTPLTSTLKSAF